MFNFKFILLMRSTTTRAEYFSKIPKVPQIDPEESSILVTEDIIEDGRVIHVTKFKTIVPQDQFKGLKAVDFCLDNRLASGAVDFLRPAMIDGSSMDDLESQVNKMQSAFSQPTESAEE